MQSERGICLAASACLDVCAKKGDFGMTQGEIYFAAEYAEGCILGFEKKILTAGSCEAFLKGSFVRTGDVERVRYDCSGYMPLTRCEFSNGLEMLDFLEKCVRAFLLACDHLLRPERMNFTGETVYRKQGNGAVRFAFVPRENRHDSVTNAFFELIRHFPYCGEEGEKNRYLRAVQESAEQNNAGLRDVLSIISELKREIHICGWNERSRG